ncbi:MAG: nickel insertion protein, partial [Tepidiformaceae bacterium]
MSGEQLPAGRIAVFDCFSGIAGDMTLAALLDAGAPLEDVRAGLARLALPAFEIEATRVQRGGLAALHVTVKVSAERTYQPEEMRALVRAAGLPARVEERARTAIGWLERGEALAHGTENPHLHEAGGVDAVVDIVGSMLALEALGIDAAWCPVVTVGAGTMTRSAHGAIPASPGPAAANLLEQAGFPTCFVQAAPELVRQTGAA